jgi:hypothetical protein
MQPKPQTKCQNGPWLIPNGLGPRKPALGKPKISIGYKHVPKDRTLESLPRKLRKTVHAIKYTPMLTYLCFTDKDSTTVVGQQHLLPPFSSPLESRPPAPGSGPSRLRCFASCCRDELGRWASLSLSARFRVSVRSSLVEFTLVESDVVPRRSS